MPRTAFVPFAKGAAWPGRIALVGGTALWLLATFAHPLAGAPTADATVAFVAMLVLQASYYVFVWRHRPIERLI